MHSLARGKGRGFRVANRRVHRRCRLKLLQFLCELAFVTADSRKLIKANSCWAFLEDLYATPSSKVVKELTYRGSPARVYKRAPLPRAAGRTVGSGLNNTVLGISSIRLVLHVIVIYLFYDRTTTSELGAAGGVNAQDLSVLLAAA